MQNLPPNIQLPGADKQKEKDNELRDIVANFLQPHALERLDRVYLVNPHKAKSVSQIILQQAQAGAVQPKQITDDQIKQMLEAISKQGVGASVVVGGIEDCTGEGKVVMKQRVEVTDGVRDMGTDELSF